MCTSFAKQDLKKVKIEILVSTQNYIANCGAKDDNAWKTLLNELVGKL